MDDLTTDDDQAPADDATAPAPFSGVAGILNAFMYGDQADTLAAEQESVRKASRERQEELAQAVHNTALEQQELDRATAAVRADSEARQLLAAARRAEAQADMSEATALRRRLEAWVIPGALSAVATMAVLVLVAVFIQVMGWAS